MPSVPGTDATTTVIESACDPLAGPPIGLGNIVGVGQDSSGTFYVDAENGVFVSSADGALIRQQIVGTGQSGTEYSFSFVPPNEIQLMAITQDLVIETSGGVATSMALGPQGSSKLPDAGGLVSLQMVPAASITGMPVVNTPNVISYAANAANGDILVAVTPQNVPTGPDDAGIYDDGLEIFYGPQNAIAQRRITAFGESLSGNGSVTFMVDGVPYVLPFGNTLSTDGGPLGTFMLGGLSRMGGSTIALTLQTPNPTAFPAAYAFTCLP